jgi:hypothetical protein
MKTICNKPTNDITLNGEKLKALFLKSVTRQGFSILPVLFSIVLKILALSGQSRKIKTQHPNWKRA